jgi:hypothetical protein
MIRIATMFTTLIMGFVDESVESLNYTTSQQGWHHYDARRD